MMATLNLNGVDIPQFCKVLSVEYPVLPTADNTFVSVPGKKGLFLMKQEENNRVITATIMIVGDDKNDIVKKARDLASWLQSDVPVPLIYGDEPDKYYMVVPSGDSLITETLFTGAVTITFVCTEVYAYGADQSVTATPADGDIIDVTVNGTAPTYPQITLTLTEDTQFIQIVSDDSFVVIGDPADVTKTPVNKKPRALHVDTGDAVTGWTTANSIETGTITGSLDSNGFSIAVKDNAYGTGSQWHGPSAIQSLATPIQDFEIAFDVFNATQAAKDLCKIELYALDANNNQMGKILIADATMASNASTFMARAGIDGSGKVFIDTIRKDVWHNMAPGTLKLGRKGNCWYAYIGNKGKNGKYNSELYKQYTAPASLPYAHNPLAKIQLAICAYGGNTVPTRWAVSALNVYQFYTPQPTEAALAGQAGDVFLIDNETMTLYKNNDVAWDLLNPVSNPIQFKNGVNGLTLSPANGSLQIDWTERWL